MVQNMMNRYQLKTCVVKGCRVGLRVSPKSDLMGKGWKIASTHEGLLQSMELPCLCGVKHAWCEGKLTRKVHITQMILLNECAAPSGVTLKGTTW